MSVNRLRLEEQYAKGRRTARFFPQPLGGGLTVSLTDSLSISDAVALRLALRRILNDSLTVTDLIQLLLPQPYLIQDSLSLTEGIRVVEGLGYTLSDVLSQVDFISLVLGLRTKLDDNLNLDDLLTAWLVFHRSVSDSFTLTEDLVGVGYGLVLRDQLAQADALVTSIFGFAAILIEDSLIIIDKLFRLGYGLHFFDNANNLNEAFSSRLAAELTQVVNGETLNFADGGINPVLFFNRLLTLNDSINNLNDILVNLVLYTQIQQTLGDSANNWQDHISKAVSRLLRLVDNLAFNDLFKYQPAAAVFIHDFLSFSDHFDSSRAHVARALTDAISFQDRLNLFQPVTPAFNDSLNNYADSLRPVLGIHLGLQDLLNLDDGIIVQHIRDIAIGLNDTLAFQEALGIQEGSITDDISYIRKYLNDAVGIQGPGDTPPIDTRPPSAIRDYLRRYLNDVQD